MGDLSVSQSEQINQLLVLMDKLKTTGNSALSAGDMNEALKLYTQGIEAGKAIGDHSKKLLSQLYSNRAAAKLNLNLFVEVVEDCRQAIEVDESNLKAYWRAAKASIHLDLYQQAIDFCENGLKIDSDHADINSLRSTAEIRLRRQTNPVRGFTEDDAMNAQNLVSQLSEQEYLVRQKIQAHELEFARNTRTVSVIGEDSSRLYKTMGRGFISDSRENILHEFEERNLEIKNVAIPSLKKSMDGIEKRKQNAEAELKEVVEYFKNRTPKS